MKKLTWIFTFSLLVVTSAFAQLPTAQMALQNGKLDDAKSAIDKAIDNPKQNVKPITWFTRGQIYEQISGSQIYNKLDSNSVIKSYDAYAKAVELDQPEGKEGKTAKKAKESMKKLLIPAGGRKFEVGDYPAALKFFELAQEANPKDTLPVLYAAYAAQNSKEYGKAAQNYEKLLASGSTDLNYYLALVQIYKMEKNYDKAISTLQAASLKYPKNEEFAKEQLNIYLQTDRKDEAIKNMEEAVKKDPSNVLYLTNLSILYAQKALNNSKYTMGSAKEGCFYVDEKGAKVSVDKSMCDNKETEKKKYNDISRGFSEKILQIEPENFDANYSVGVFYFNEAAELSQKINADEKKLKNGQIDPRTKDMNENFKKSGTYFEKALKVKSDDIDTLTNLSKVYKQLADKVNEARINKMIEKL